MHTLGTQRLTIDTASRRPIYEQLAEGLKELIARDELREGVALPPVRQLAADLGVNLNTVAVAYRQLQSEGLIAVRHGSGAVVLSRTTGEHSDAELRKPLRAALTQLVLSGLPHFPDHAHDHRGTELSDERSPVMSALVCAAIAMFAARLFLLHRLWRLPQRHGEGYFLGQRVGPEF
jgi:GntR family transcriptional regulator